MREVHEGICGNHSRSRSPVHKLMQTGYYWPTMQADAEAYVKAYNKCQRFSNIIRQPTEELAPMTAPWPFAQWRLDIMEPFPTAVRQLKLLVVDINYFTKWVEAKTLATIIEKNVRSFVWRCIIYRFGIPRVLVSDNGKQFDNDSFQDFCSQLGIRNPTPPSPTNKPTASRGYEPILAQDHQDSARGGKGHLAGGASKHFLSIPDDSKNTHRGNAISTSIRE